MTAPDKYARVYYKVVHDKKFETIYPDDRHLAAWLRLLIMADAAWPTYPPIPRTIRKPSLDALVSAGLVDLLPQDCFRIHGLDKERNARAQQARDAAAKRWDSASNADALPSHEPPASASNAYPMLAKQSKAEQSTPEQAQTPAQGWDEPEGEALTWLARHGCYLRPGNGYHQKLVLAVTNHGVNAVVGMFDRLARAGVKDGDDKGFVFGAIDALNGKPDLSAIEREAKAEEAAVQHSRKLAATQRLLAEQRGERTAEA